MSATLRLLVPQGTTNYCKNPSVEVDTTDWNADSAAISRSLDEARFGIASLKVITNGAGLREGTCYRVSSFTNYNGLVTGSIYVRGQGLVHARLIDNPAGKEWVSDPIKLSSSRWQRIDVTGRSTGSNDFRLYIETHGDSIQSVTFYVDGAQIEKLGYVTTYCDGDQDGCRWDLMEHASNSVRSDYTRQGGRWLDMAGPSCEEQDLYMTVVGGMGMASIRNQTQDYADAPGAFYQSAKTLSRLITLTFHAKRKYKTRSNELPSLSALHELRQQLLDVIKPDKTAGAQAFLLEYQDGEIPLYLWVRYDGGLEGEWDVRNQFVNSFPLRLLAVSPYWFEDDQETDSLNFRNTQTINYALQRIDGVWSDMNGGFNGQVLGFTVGPRGQIVAYGNFILANHKSGAIDEDIFANFIAWWDGEKWNEYGTGADDIIRDAHFGPNGNLWVTGDFTTLLGVACNYVGYIDTNGVAHAMGAGLNAPGYAIRAASDGDVYVGGAFTTADGVTVNYFTRYDGTFHATGVYTGLNGTVLSIDITQDASQVYLCGEFTDENTSPAILSLNYVALFEPLFNQFDELGTGFDAIARKVLVTESGRVYCAGDFTESNDAALILLYLAYWNGASWFEVGIGADNTIRDLSFSKLGMLLLGGDFTRAGSVDSFYAALFNDSAYVNLDAVLPAAVYGVIFDRQENIFIAPNGTTAEFAAISTVENIGSAETHPVLYITGPATLIWFENQSTKKRVYADLVIAENEEITIDFSQGTVLSNTRGNIVYSINPGSDLRAWTLIPGNNKIALLMTNDVAATAHISYIPRHWSADHTVLAKEL